MKRNTRNINFIYNEGGKGLLSILEKILKIVAQTSEEGEIKCQRKE